MRPSPSSWTVEGFKAVESTAYARLSQEQEDSFHKSHVICFHETFFKTVAPNVKGSSNAGN